MSSLVQRTQAQFLKLNLYLEFNVGVFLTLQAIIRQELDFREKLHKNGGFIIIMVKATDYKFLMLLIIMDFGWRKILVLGLGFLINV